MHLGLGAIEYILFAFRLQNCGAPDEPGYKNKIAGNGNWGITQKVYKYLHNQSHGYRLLTRFMYNIP